MTHGRPDWVRATTLQDVRDVFGNIPEVGMGELAARLGSINLFERRGEVIFMDDFEDSTVKWTKSGAGVDPTALRSITTARTRNYSYKVITSAEVGNWTDVTHYHRLPPSTRLGFEFSFALGSSLTYVWSRLYLDSKTDRYWGQLEYNPPSKLLRISIGTDTWVNLETDFELWEKDNIFHTWKLVIDYETKKYVRAYLNDKSYDLSAYALRHTSDTYTPAMYLNARIANAASGKHYIYIDDVIATQNEP